VEVRDLVGGETMDAGRSFQCSLMAPDWWEVVNGAVVARGIGEAVGIILKLKRVS
jgi:hypothetical protein